MSPHLKALHIASKVRGLSAMRPGMLHAVEQAVEVHQAVTRFAHADFGQLNEHHRVRTHFLALADPPFELHQRGVPLPDTPRCIRRVRPSARSPASTGAG